jgi:hypothetical protein
MTRKVALRLEEWESRAETVRERLIPVLRKQPGFLGWDLFRTPDGSAMTEVTRWDSLEHCRRYVRDGGAALAATIMDAIIPTAPYPDGTWNRATYETVGP